MSIIWLLLISNNDWLVQKSTFYLHETQLSNHETLRKKFTKIFEYRRKLPKQSDVCHGRSLMFWILINNFLTPATRDQTLL